MKEELWLLIKLMPKCAIFSCLFFFEWWASVPCSSELSFWHWSSEDLAKSSHLICQSLRNRCSILILNRIYCGCAMLEGVVRILAWVMHITWVTYMPRGCRGCQAQSTVYQKLGGMQWLFCAKPMYWCMWVWGSRYQPATQVNASWQVKCCHSDLTSMIQHQEHDFAQKQHISGAFGFMQMLNCTCSGVKSYVVHCTSFWSWLLVPLGQLVHRFVCTQACWTFGYARCCNHILPITFLVWTRYMPFHSSMCMCENLQLIACRNTILRWY